MFYSCQAMEGGGVFYIAARLWGEEACSRLWGEGVIIYCVSRGLHLHILPVMDANFKVNFGGILINSLWLRLTFSNSTSLIKKKTASGNFLRPQPFSNNSEDALACSHL